MKDHSIKKGAFILYKSFYEPISQLTDEQLGRLFRAIFRWQSSGFEDVEPDIRIAFSFFVNQFRIDEDKYQERCEKNRENIMKRWNTSEYKRIQSYSNNTDNDNENDNENENDSIESAKATPSAPTHKRKRFVKPSLSEIEEYCMSRSNGIDASKFFDFYESKGWKVGNQPMKDWRACVRTWEKKEGRQASSLPLHQPRQGTVLYPDDIYKD